MIDRTLRLTPDTDPELQKLMDGFCDAEEAGDMVGYVNQLPEPQRDKLLTFMCQQVLAYLKKDLN